MFACLFGRSQQCFSYVRPGLPDAYQYEARINVSWSRTQHIKADEARICKPSVSSQTLYHRATVNPSSLLFVPTTAEVIWRWSHGLKSHLTGWRSWISNLRSLGARRVVGWLQEARNVVTDIHSEYLGLNWRKVAYLSASLFWFSSES